MLLRINNINTLLRSYSAKLFFYFLAFYFILVYIARTTYYRDPSSAFFDPERGYLPAYSHTRSEQADSYIDSVNKGAIWPVKSSENANLCVGIASIARDGVRYFKTAVGSVLEGLSESERANIHLILFIAHSDPSQHPAYSENWLHNVADTVLKYDPDKVDISKIVEWEQAHNKAMAREKGLFDYTYLLQACHATSASYVAILEDDVVALDGWLHRSQGALATAERQTNELGRSQFLYLRMFYTEEFLGWNSEDWATYTFFSLLTIIAVSAGLFGIRQWSSPYIKQFITNEAIYVVAFLCTPLLIGLFFACGRVSMLPMTYGVAEMPKFGCCSQGFIFPQSRVPDLIQWYQSKHVGYVDMLTEEYADQNNELRWAVTPSLLQHVGSKSSKSDDFASSPKYHRSVAERIWNFAFEVNDPVKLRVEHRGHSESY